MPEMNLDFILIIVGVTLGLVFLILLVVLLEVLYFSIRRMKNKYNEFNHRYAYLHDLVTSQDKQYIERIDSISRTNLLFLDVYNKYLDIYKKIRETYDEPLGKVLNELRISVNEKDRKGFKLILNHNLPLLEEYAKEASKLNDELILVIKPEEDCRQSNLMLRGKYRNIKKLYDENETKLESLEHIFHKLFVNIDTKFNEFENALETSQFDEAKTYLKPLTKVLNEIEIVLEKLPNYLDEVNNIIPLKMGTIKAIYESLIDTQLPLRHLNFDESMEYIKKSLITIRDNFEKLSLNKAEETISFAHRMLDDLENKMKEEDKARTEFNEKYPLIMNSYIELDKNIVKLNNLIPTYAKYYLINDTNQLTLDSINDELDSISKIKRRVDFYVHGLERTYYTDLLLKINDLGQGIDELNNKYLAFKNLLESFKNDVNSAYSLINEIYLKTKNSESIIRDFLNPSLILKFKEEINQIYSLMDIIDSLLKESPINVSEVNNNVTILKSVSSNLFLKVEELKNYSKLSEENILFINRERTKFSDIHNLLVQAENLYYSGEYKSSYEQTEEILNKLKDKQKVIK